MSPRLRLIVFLGATVVFGQLQRIYPDVLPEYGSATVTFASAPAWPPASSFRVWALPLNTTYDFARTAAVSWPSSSPDERQGWLWENSDQTSNATYQTTFRFDASGLVFTARGIIDANVTRGKAPYLLRRVPITGRMDTRVAACSGIGQPNHQCGIVVFHGGANQHMFVCGVTRRSDGSTALEMSGVGAVLASASLGPGSSIWPTDGVFLRVSRDAVADTWTCSGTASQPADASDAAWASAVSLSISDARLMYFHEGDAWYGVGVRAWGGSNSSTGTATFSYVRVYVPPPVTNPTDVNGRVDVCIAPGGVQPRFGVITARAGVANMTVKITGLSQNFPYTISIEAVAPDGSATVVSEPMVHMYARPMPPFWWNLAVWLDSKFLPVGSLNLWPDSSGNQHFVSRSASGVAPSVQSNPSYYGNVNGIVFNRASGAALIGGTDSYDLGITSSYAGYAVVRPFSSAFAIIAGRGPFDPFSSTFGWTFGVAASVWSPWPGYIGVRAHDSLGLAAGAMRDSCVSWQTYAFGFSVNENTRNNPADQRWQPYMPPMVIGSTNVSNTTCSPVQVTNTTSMLVNGTMVNGTLVNATRVNVTQTYTISECVTRNVTINVTTPYPFRTAFTPKVMTTVRNQEASTSYSSSIPYPNFQYGFAFGDNFTAPVSVTWGRLPNETASPAFDPSTQSFQIGGPGPTPDTMRSFSGELFSTILYRKGQTRTQQSAVMSWIESYYNFVCDPIDSPETNTWGACYPGVRESWCNQACLPGFAFQSGYELHWCGPGTFSAAPLVCRKVCGTYTAPKNVLFCNKTLLMDAFDNPYAMRRYITFPQVSDVTRRDMWVHNVSTPMVSGSTTDACRRLAPSILGIHPNRWDSIIPYGQPQRARVSITLGTPATRAGVVIRLTDEKNNYAILASISGGITVARVQRGVYTLLGTYVNATLAAAAMAPGMWFTLEGTHTGTMVQVRVNNMWVMNVSDPLGALVWGSAGMYLDGTASFDNFTIISTCDGGAECRQLTDGQRCDYGCKPGYTMYSVSNGTISCDSSGVLAGSMVCFSLPPTMLPQSFSVLEKTENGKPLGIVQAIPASVEQALVFTIESTWMCNNRTTGAFMGCNATAGNGTFNINSCSGVLTVARSASLSFRNAQIFILSVRASPDGEMIGSVVVNMTVFLINVIEPPIWTVAPLQLSVRENYAGLMPPSLSVFSYDDDDIPLTYSFLYGNTGGDFALDALSGNMSVARAINFEVTSSFSLLIQQAHIDDASMASTVAMQVTVINMNDPPTCAPQTYFIDESVAGASSPLIVGAFLATDEDAINAATLSSMNLTGWYALNYNLTGNAASNVTRRPLFALNSSTLILLEPLKYTAAQGFYWWGAFRVRQVFSLNVTVCDGGPPVMCASSTPVTVAIIANYTAPLQPIIFSMQLPIRGLATEGGEVVTFTGRDFDTAAVVTSRYCSAAICRAALGCAVVSSTSITCLSAEGYGVGFSWNVTLNNLTLPTTVPLTSSYAAPILSSVTVDVGTPATSGGNFVTLTGRFLSGWTSVISIALGSSGEFTMVPTYANHSIMLAQLSPGCGANLPVVVTVSGQVSTSATPSATQISYAPPVISALSAPASAGYTITSLATAGGQDVQIDGSSFGPYTISGALVVPTAWYAGGISYLYNYTAVCRKDDTGRAHSRIMCSTAPGVSTSFQWRITVCGQLSAPAPANTSYRAPVLSEVSGQGSQDANTNGGQLIVLSGQDFGFVGSGVVGAAPVITAVRYGFPGVWQYAAVGCAVVSTLPATIQCATAEGTGRNHSWQLAIGGQWSNVLAAGTGYAAPVISQFNGDGCVSADTAGGSVCAVQGFNFGPSMSVVSITYVSTMTVVRDADGLLPLNGSATYRPTNCSFILKHNLISCTLAPGAGKGIRWFMVVDGQASASPTTAYSPPAITDVALLGGITVASADGGDRVIIRGLNFGLQSVIQRVRYGPTANEYRAVNVQFINTTCLVATLAPGIGQGHRFSVMIADQPSTPSVATISYASPSITKVAPSAAMTDYSASRPTVVTVTGLNFGVLDPTVDVAVAFGNAGDGTLVGPLPITARYPSPNDITAPGFTWAPNTPQWVSFSVPESLGANRSVRVVPYKIGSPPDRSAMLAVPVIGIADVFSFTDPYLDYIVVSAVTLEADRAAMLSLFVNVPNWSAARKLELNGHSFGPAQSVLGDSIGRILQYQSVDTYSASGAWSSITALPYNWTHTKITAFTMQGSGVVRVMLQSVGPNGGAQAQASGPSWYLDVSPSVSGIVGASTGFNTQGGQQITFRAQGLGATTVLNVTVGGAPCTLLTGPGGTEVSSMQARPLIILAAGTPPFAANFQWTITCIAPPGQGSNVPVVLLRDGIRSSAAVTISYAPPSITRVGVWDPTTSSFLMTPWNAPNPLYVATHDAQIRVEGTNFGLCPTISVYASTLTTIPFCVTTLSANGFTSVSTRNPNMTFDHTFLQFTVPQGEGTGLWADVARGWTVNLDVSDQQPSAPILLRYLPPIVSSVSPSTGPTRGNITVTVAGDNMGSFSQPRVWIGTPILWSNCTNVTRVSQRSLTCTLPALITVGTGLQVRVQVADLIGVGASFNYTAPNISSVALITLNDTGVVDTVQNTSRLYSFVTSADTSLEAAAPLLGAGATPYSAASMVSSMLALPTLPGSYALLRGSNLGSAAAVGLSCAFVVWDACLPRSGVTPATACVPVCDGAETFPGEGEVAGSDILFWSHELILIRLGNVAGMRFFTVTAGGQQLLLTRTVPDVATPPMMAVTLPHDGARSTNGGNTVRILGVNLPSNVLLATADLSSGGSNSSVAVGALTPPLLFPKTLPLPTHVRVPLAHVRINFAGVCITDAVGVDGRVPPELSTCMRTGPLSISRVNNPPYNALTSSGRVNGSWTTVGTLSLRASPVGGLDELSFTTPPGVGVNKTVSVSLLDNGRLLWTSNALNFSYDPPRLTETLPYPLFVTSASFYTLSVLGDNLGRLADMGTWTAAEQALSVSVSGVECSTAQRVLRRGADMIQCQLPATAVVGYKNVSVLVAGQVGVMPTSNPRTVFVVCGPGAFGFTGESCLPCVDGALCQGFLTDIGVSQPPGKYGAVEVDVGLTGIHTYPVPKAEWYNLNGSQVSACPEGMNVPGRDVCIVPCQPPEACVGNNFCSDAYVSGAPMFRCGLCAPKYFRANGECQKCPDSPVALIIGFVLIAGFAGGLAYWMHKMKINVGFVSIGIDYVQVLAIFANSKVPWPPSIKTLFQILSAFNLNIEIIPPECIVPNVQFTTKWAIIIVLPVAVFILFMALQVFNMAWIFLAKGQRDCRRLAEKRHVYTSSALLLMYFLYLYETRSILEVFNCLPTQPPDGKTYLQATFEPCGVPGGTQLRLMPFAIIALAVYTAGYPAFLARTFYRNRELIMEDQLLRALGVGDDKLTNPNAYGLRRAYGRAYYQFKPDIFWWVLVIIGRKFLISVVALMFRRNAAFQLAMILLVMFLAYAAQVKWNPYLHATDHEAVLADHLRSSLTSPLHARLRANLAGIAARGRKRTTGGRRAIMTNGRFQPGAALGAVGAWLFHYNTVESILLFSAVLVCLLGIMFSAMTQSYYADMKDGVAYAVIIIVSASLFYFVSVVVLEIMQQARDRKEAALQAKERTGIWDRSGKGAASQRDGSGKRTATDTILRPRSGRSGSTMENALNPMFATPAESDGSWATEKEAIMSCSEAPNLAMWELFRHRFSEVVETVEHLRKELLDERKRAAQLSEALEAAGLGAIAQNPGGLAPNVYSRVGKRIVPGARTRKDWRPEASRNSSGRRNRKRQDTSDDEVTQPTPDGEDEGRAVIQHERRESATFVARLRAVGRRLSTSLGFSSDSQSAAASPTAAPVEPLRRDSVAAPTMQSRSQMHLSSRPRSTRVSVTRKTALVRRAVPF